MTRAPRIARWARPACRSLPASTEREELTDDIEGWHGEIVETIGLAE